MGARSPKLNWDCRDARSIRGRTVCLNWLNGHSAIKQQSKQVAPAAAYACVQLYNQFDLALSCDRVMAFEQAFASVHRRRC